MADAGVRVLDWTAAAQDPPPRLIRDGKARFAYAPDGRRIWSRPAAMIDTLCVHQTACHFGPSDVDRRNQRALDIPIHAVAFRDGTVIRPYPVLWDLWHGNGWNRRSVGIEIEGTYAGLEDDPTTTAVREDLASWGHAPGAPDGLTGAALAAAREGCRVLVEAARAAGCPLRYVVAHRQSSPDRRADPGALIWRLVVLEYVVPVLGLACLPGGFVTNGRPIPRAWDPVSGQGAF